MKGAVDEKALSEIRGAASRRWPVGSERFKDQIEVALQCVARHLREDDPQCHEGRLACRQIERLKCGPGPIFLPPIGSATDSRVSAPLSAPGYWACPRPQTLPY